MKLGLAGINVGTLAVPQFGRLAALAEELGYDSLWTAEHIVLPDLPDKPVRRNSTGLLTLREAAAYLSITGRKRKPTLASVSRQARTAGIEVAAYEVRPDGTIKVITGKPTVVSDGDDASPIDRSEWN